VSYRRRFIRICWQGLAILPVLVLLLVSGALEWVFRSFAPLPWPKTLAWGLVVVETASFIAHAAYTYIRWRREARQTAADGCNALGCNATK